MRIERLEIDGFGRFHDVRWTFDEGLTVLLGENEAGKTTLLNALRALLFGFESTRDGRTWYPAFAGGRRGGRLVLRTRRGEVWTVERHGDRGGSGTLVVRAPNGNQGGQETLDRLLHGADRDLFTNIFAFGLGELQTFSSLSADGVRGRIYGAGAGLGGTSAIDLERRLRSEMDEMFLPRGRERPLNRALARIEELRAEIAELGRQPREHAEAHAEREALRARAGEVREAIRGERRRQARMSQLLAARGPAAEAAILGEELANGDETLDRLAPDAVALLDRHLAAVDEARDALVAAEMELASARADRERLAPDADILAAADEIGAVRDARAARAGTAERRRELVAAIARHTHAVDEQVARSGLGTEARLVALDDSIGTVERTREHERRAAAAREALADLERRARHLAQDIAAREAGAGDPPDEAALDARAAALDELDGLRLRRAVADARSGQGLPAWAGPAAAAVVAVAVLLIGTLAGQPVLGVLGAAGLGPVTWWLLRGLFGGAGTVDDLAHLESERRVLLERAGLSPDAEDDAVRRAASEVSAARARAALAADGRAALEARRHELTAAERELEAARVAVAEAEAAWSSFLSDANLPAGLSPEVARQLLTAAGVARRAAVERDDHQRRLTALESDEEAWSERLGRLAERLGTTPGADESGRDAFALRIGEQLDAERDTERRARSLDGSIERHIARAKQLETALAEREGTLAAFLTGTGCPDADALRRRDRQAAARRDAAARLRELRAELAGMAGGADEVDRLTADARAADPAQLQAASTEAAEQLGRLEEEEREVLNRIGALDARIDQLERAEELGMRRQELASLEGRAATLARRWAARALALRLLAETRSRYERERQPDVVRAASEQFERITGGRYARVVAPPGEGAVRVETETGLARTTDELSRGTAEQLYLSLRFGLIDEFARSAEPLPVVMDDILVNFDVDRAGRAAAAIADLAERHQVLYFTCHRHVAELMDPAGARTLTLG